jgi:carboxyl-terminal processing protease
MKNNKILYLLVMAFMMGISGCKKEPIDKEPEVKEPSEISTFIWYGMHDYYLWYSQVPNLANSMLTPVESFYEFLNQYTDYEDLFHALLYKYGEVDKWSFIVDDYTVLENTLSGISKSFGMDYKLYKYSNSDGVFGIVRYVLPNSPADLAGIKRGDIFIQVDGSDLTISNYQALLFDKESLTFSFAYISNNIIYPNGVSRSVTEVEMQEDPVLYHSVLDLGGIKTGYLVYNGFTSDFDFELNDVFGEFKDAGIEKLILDLRYNGGGALSSAIYLASMIYSTDTTMIFSKAEYNDKLQAYLVTVYGSNALNYYFADSIVGKETATNAPIHSLGLTDLYVLTTDGTASASELVINGLIPYINVTIVGDHTYGKYVGSITVKDYDNEGNLNTSHKYAMQPIVLKISNSEGVSDYVDGLPADVVVYEDMTNMLPFGDVNETLLSAAIAQITGGKKMLPMPPSYGMAVVPVVDSKDMKPLGKDMYVDDSRLTRLEMK